MNQIEIALRLLDAKPRDLREYELEILEEAVQLRRRATAAPSACGGGCHSASPAYRSARLRSRSTSRRSAGRPADGMSAAARPAPLRISFRPSSYSLYAANASLICARAADSRL